MIALLGASAITLAALQASINAPTDAFRSCLKEASAKATGEKVAANAFEAYARAACTSESGALKAAVVAFRKKNGMGAKAAAADADMTIDDYVATSVDKYSFMAEMNAPKPQQQPQATPAAAPQPPKQP
jgi:hypothetical protein